MQCCDHRPHSSGTKQAVPIALGAPLNSRRNAVVSCSSSSSSWPSSDRAPILAGATGEPNGRDPGFDSNWAHRRDEMLGSLTEEGLSYKEKFIVRCYEVGINKTATVETIANLLQEVLCNHAQSLGFSTDGFATTHIMRKLHLIWVTARLHIEVYKYPAWGEVVEIETWWHNEGRIRTRRHSILKEYATGKVIGRATCKLLMMNQDTRRLQKVADEVREECLIYCPKEPRLAFLEKTNGSLKKISKLEDPAQYSRLGLMPRRADMDINQHVNNVTYVGCVLESMPEEIIDTHELQTIALEYGRECQHDDVVDSLTSPEPEPDEDTAVLEVHESNGSAAEEKDYCQFLHSLRLSSDGLEINWARAEWKKKQAS